MSRLQNNGNKLVSKSKRNKSKNLAPHADSQIEERLKKWSNNSTAEATIATTSSKSQENTKKTNHYTVFPTTVKAQQQNDLWTCICERESKLLQCSHCKMLMFGRVFEICQRHRNLSYLMDFTCCPFCQGRRDYLVEFKRS